VVLEYLRLCLPNNFQLLSTSRGLTCSSLTISQSPCFFYCYITLSYAFVFILSVKAAIKGFNTQMTARIEKGESIKDDKVFQDLVSDVSYSYYSGSPMVDAYQIIRNLDETALGTFCDAIPGVSAWSFIYKLDSMLRGLLRNAIYTCHKFSLDMEPAAALAKTLVSDMAHKVMLHAVNSNEDVLSRRVSDLQVIASANVFHNLTVV